MHATANGSFVVQDMKLGYGYFPLTQAQCSQSEASSSRSFDTPKVLQSSSTVTFGWTGRRGALECSVSTRIALKQLYRRRVAAITFSYWCALKGMNSVSSTHVYSSSHAIPEHRAAE